MFGLFGIIAKRIGNRVAQLAAAGREAWREKTAILQPVRIETASARERRLRRLAMQEALLRRR